jgi:hypothetical protein
MKENYYLDDGTYSASQIIIIMVKRYLEGLGKDIYKSLLADLEEPVESNEFRLKLKVSHPQFKPVYVDGPATSLDRQRCHTMISHVLLATSLSHCLT